MYVQYKQIIHQQIDLFNKMKSFFIRYAFLYILTMLWYNVPYIRIRLYCNLLHYSINLSDHRFQSSIKKSKYFDLCLDKLYTTVKHSC